MLINNLTKLNRSSRNAASAALIVIAAIAMYNWIVAPQATCLSAAQRYESVMGNIVKKNKVIVDTVKSKKKKLQELRDQLARFQSILFTPDEARDFFSDLQAISEQAGCTVYSLNFITGKLSPEDGRSENTSGVVAKGVVLSVVGVYKNIIKLIERLQARTQKVWIDSVNMQILDHDSAQPKCNITITIYTIQDKETTLNE